MDPVLLHGVSEGVALGLAAATGVVSFGAGVLYARVTDRGPVTGTDTTVESAD